MPQHILAILLVLLHTLPGAAAHRLSSAPPTLATIASASSSDATCGCQCSACACPCSASDAPALPADKPEPTNTSTDRPTIIPAGHPCYPICTPDQDNRPTPAAHAFATPRADQQRTESALCRWLT